MFLALFGFARVLHAEALTQWVHEQWQTGRGLPQNSVFCFAQDTNGFLWFGTENGLVRYDGVQFRTFNQQTPPAIRHNFVSSLLMARDGSLWAATKTAGLARYRADAMYEPYEVVCERNIFALAEGPDGSIWGGTKNGLVQVTDKMIRIYGPRQGLIYDKVSALCFGRDGTLWIGSDNGELAALRNGTVRHVPHPDQPHRSSILGLCENPVSGELWIAHDGDGLFRLRDEVMERIALSGREFENLQAICLDGEGALWIGAQREGVLRYKNNEVSRFSSEDGLATDYVISLFADREGSVWAGTLFGGLNRLHRGAVRTFGRKEGLDSETVTCVLAIDPDTLWIGTRSEGVLKFRRGKFQPVPAPISREIRAILRTSDADVWFGGKDGGLVRQHGETQELVTTAQGLIADDVASLYETRAGEVWVGTRRDGITVLDRESGRVKRTLNEKFFQTHIRCFAEDKKGVLWIGTQNGLVQYKDDVFHPEYIKGREDACVRSIYIDAHDTLWLGMRDDGLLRLNDKSLFRFDAKTGLLHTRVYQLLPVGDDLWIAGNRGIEHVSLSELEAVANGRRARLAARLFTEQDGLRTAECGGDSSSSAAVGRDGVLWFGTRRGLAEVTPKVALAAAAFPRVTITNVRLDNAVVSPGLFTEVPAGTTRIQFSYAAPSLRDGGEIAYCYKLDGVDKDWVDAGKDREAAYYHLKPGKHKFTVCASNAQGEWGPEKNVISFIVRPRFYQTPWFVAFAIIGGTASVRAIYRARVAAIQRRNEKLQRLVRDRTQKLEEEILQRKRAEEQQIALNLDLEGRVAARTGELTTAYVNLQQELRERERIEAELAASESRLRRVVDSGMVGILFWHKDGRILDANDIFLRMVGYTREELRRGELQWLKITPPEYAPLDQAALLEIERAGVCTPFEKEYIRKDGTRFPVLLGGACLDRITDEGVCFAIDISERKASEEEIRRLAQSLEARVQERTLELARINEQLASEVQERKRVAIALSAFSQLGQKLHGARTEKEAANIIALAAKSLIPHDLCSIELYGPDNRLYPVIRNSLKLGSPSSEPMRSSISVPIRNGSRVVGVIGVQSTTPDSLNIADANTLQALGDYCGGALDRIHAEEARRETERRFSAFMVNAPALAWMKNSRLRYVFSNPMFQEFLGRSEEQIEDKTDNELWPESTAARIRNNDLRVLESEQTLETQETLRRADEESRTLLTLRFPFTTANGERFVAGMAVDITEQKRAEEVLHRLPQSILEAQEQERRRLARELHDSVNQVIASAKFRIQTAENQILRGDPKWQESCSKSKEMLDLVLKQVRRLSHNLRPGELDDLGLVPAVRTALREFQDRTGIAVHFSALGFEQRFEATLESTLYRIIQEALTNIEKHSSATTVEVELIDSELGVTLEIADNGIGIDPGQGQRVREGLGLVHMRERAGLVGGTFAIETQPGEGVRIRIHVPAALQPVLNS